MNTKNGAAGEWRQALLRPAAYAAAAGLHALVLFGVDLPRAALSSPVETIEISVTQEGDATPDMARENAPDAIAQQQAAPDAKVEPTPDKDEPPPPPQAQEEKPDPVAAEKPKREVDDALAIAERQRERRLEKLREKRREELREEREEERREAAKRRRIAAQKAAAQSARRARAGAANGAAHGMSRASYSSLFMRELRRHQIHAAGSGTVGVAFSVGPSGHVSSASVVSSSGAGALDSAALRMVRACHPGPPPGGHFSGVTRVNFY